MNAFAQNGGGTMGSGTTGGSVASVYNFHSNYLIGFDSPEGWGFKYFASTINQWTPACRIRRVPGWFGNPTACVGESHDKASLRYAGMEF